MREMNPHQLVSLVSRLIPYGCLVFFLIPGLGLIGCKSQEQKIQKLITQLASEDAQARGEAALELERIGEPAVPMLVKTLRDSNPSLRANVVWKLSEIGKPVEQVVPALIRALGDAHENVRVSASLALAGMGVPAVPFLIEALSDEEAAIRLHGAYALGEIGEPVEKIIPALIGRLNDKEWNVRRVCVRALVNIGEPAVPLLTEALNNSDPDTRRFAQIALDQMKHRTR